MPKAIIYLDDFRRIVVCMSGETKNESYCPGNRRWHETDDFDDGLNEFDAMMLSNLLRRNTFKIAA